MNRSSNIFINKKKRFESVFDNWCVECDGGEELVGRG